MEGLTPHSACLTNVQRQARELTSSALSLVNMFANEASRLYRTDEASRLKALCSSILQQMDWAEMSEGAERCGDSQARLIASLGGLAVGVIAKMTSNDKHPQAFSHHPLKKLGDQRHPFGTVLIRIGPKGLPDDVQVVSISQLARESNREESKVINELQRRGYLLFSRKTFSLLIEKAISDVQEGRLLLPISMEKLSQIKP